MRPRHILLCTIGLLVMLAYGASPRRTRKDVQQERARVAGEIEQAGRQLDAKTREVQQQYDQLSSLRAAIDERSAQITAIKGEIAAIEQGMAAIADSITLAEAEMQRQHQAMGASLRAQRSQRQRMSATAMVFAAPTFRQALRKIDYLRQADKYRKARHSLLRQQAEALEAQRLRLEDERSRHADKVDVLAAEVSRLDSERAQAARVASDLDKERGRLRQVLEQRRRQAAKLDAELNAIIAEEQRQAEEARRRAEAEQRARQERERAESQNKNDNNDDGAPQKDRKQRRQHDATPSLPASGTGIAASKGRLPYPVSGRHTVVGQFGRRHHSDLQYVEVENNGIDIETDPGAQARAVYDGTVSSVFYMEGYHNIVMVRHGEYLTVYAGIDRLSVAKGDNVTAGQALGPVYADPSTSRAVLHFEIRHERQKLDPMEWIGR